MTETGIAVQTEITGQDLQKKMDDWEFINQQNITMKTKITLLNLTIDAFADNDQKTKYFTGLDYNLLSGIYNDIKQFIPQHFNTSLDPFSQLLLTLMKLRLNLDFTDLSYRFRISLSTASNFFSSRINILYERYHTLIIWPDGSTL